MPPFSLAWKGFIANSMKPLLPRRPCQPCVEAQPGSTRPVEPAWPLAGSKPGSLAGQSAAAQYREPGTRSSVGRCAVGDSIVLANPLAMVESPQGDVAPLAVHGTGF